MTDAATATPAHQRQRLSLSEIEARLTEAILTVIALPAKIWPPRLRSMWPDIRFDANEAYGWSDARRPRSQPSRAAIDRMVPTLLWLKVLDDRGRQIAWARALRAPWWRLAAKHGRSEHTLRDWHRAGLMTIQARLEAGELG